MYQSIKHFIVTCTTIAGSTSHVHASWLPWFSSPSSPPPPKSGTVYAWGRYFGKNPQKLDIPNAISVSIHDSLGCAVTVLGTAYAFTPTGITHHLPLNTRVISTAIRGNTAEVNLLDDTGRVYRTHKTHTGEFTPIKQLQGALRRARITDISCGANHCIAIDDRGSAYSWGSSNDHGELCISSENKSDDFDTPQKITLPSDCHIVQASCGDRHSLLLTSKGEVYSAGDDKWTQLGKDAEPWVKNKENTNGETDPNNLTKAQLIADLPVQQVGCGSQHSVVLVRDGTLFSFGYNMYGQLGHHNFCTFAPPSPIANMKIRASQISAGGNATCIIGNNELKCIGATGNNQSQPNMKWRHVYEVKSNGGKRILQALSVAQGGDSCAIIATSDQEQHEE